MYKIWVVEDDRVIAESLCKYLRGWGYETAYASDFEHIVEEFQQYAPHLVLMDISLPFYNGFHWCTQLRQLSHIPIVFLSSADDNLNIVMAMNMGADDFIAKPFDLSVLVAKVQALLRRTYTFSGQMQTLSYRGAVLNLGDMALSMGDKRTELSKNEFHLLQMLMENKGKTVSRDQLIKRLWDDESFIDDNTLTVNMTRLRKKLEELGLDNAIQTKKGVGYLLEEE